MKTKTKEPTVKFMIEFQLTLMLLVCSVVVDDGKTSVCVVLEELVKFIFCESIVFQFLIHKLILNATN